MARTTGDFPVSTNFEPKIAGLLDARQYVPNPSNLTEFGTTDLLPLGFPVLVAGQSNASERGWYQLDNPSAPNLSASWSKMNGDGGTSYTFQNGIDLTGSTVELGGFVGKSISFTSDYYALLFGDVDLAEPFDVVYFDISSEFRIRDENYEEFSWGNFRWDVGAETTNFIDPSDGVYFSYSPSISGGLKLGITGYPQANQFRTLWSYSADFTPTDDKHLIPKKYLDDNFLTITSFNSQQKFKGQYTSTTALNTAHPTANIGDYANVDAGSGNAVQRYIWDSNDNAWVTSTSSGTGGGSVESVNNVLPDGAGNVLLTYTEILPGVKTISGTTYTILAEDNGKILLFTNTSGCTVTLPDSLTIGVQFTAQSKVSASIVFNATTTLNSPNGNQLVGQYNHATFYKESASIWVGIIGGETDLSNYVTLDSLQTITGEKRFDLPISYKNLSFTPTAIADYGQIYSRFGNLVAKAINNSTPVRVNWDIQTGYMPTVSQPFEKQISQSNLFLSQGSSKAVLFATGNSFASEFGFSETASNGGTVGTLTRPISIPKIIEDSTTDITKPIIFKGSLVCADLDEPDLSIRAEYDFYAVVSKVSNVITITPITAITITKTGGVGTESVIYDSANQRFEFSGLKAGNQKSILDFIDTKVA